MVNSKTKFEKIFKSVAERINSGELRYGSRLPGQFALAKEYKVSSITANRALNELAQAGYIERRERAGSFVSKKLKALNHLIITQDDYYREIGGHTEREQKNRSYISGVLDESRLLKIKTDMMDLSSRSFEDLLKRPEKGIGIILLGYERPEAVKKIQGSGIPFVVAGRDAHYARYNVIENRRLAGRLLTQKFLNKGCRNIAFIGDIPCWRNNEKTFYPGRKYNNDFLFGYIEARRPQWPDYDMVRFADIKNVLEKIRELISAPDKKPDSIIISGGDMPVAALPFILDTCPEIKTGIMNEQEISMDFRDVAYIAFTDPADVGREAVRLLDKVISGKINCMTTVYPQVRILEPDK